MKKLFCFLLVMILSACSQSPSVLTAPYSEVSQGDLSDDRANPTNLVLKLGDNSLEGSTEQGDLDYFSFSVPQGQQLSELLLTNYESLDSFAFIAVQRGKVFTEPNEGTVEENLLGHVLFGLDEVGKNLLPVMGSQKAVQGFTPPLASGEYSFWLQQTGATTNYVLNFVLSESP